MKEAFDKIIESVLSDVQKNLNQHQADRLPDSSRPLSFQGTGKIPFKFHLDQDGNYHFEAEKFGAGVTVHLTAWINGPDATYSLTVSSSDGGGGHWDNLKAQQKAQCNIETSLWHSTKVKADIHAGVKNVDGDGLIEYSY
jgi:hypothetical protein